MAEGNKDLEELTKEHKDLSDQLRRAAILSLTVLALFVISFSRACQKANGEEAKEIMCQLKKTAIKTDQAADVSYIFEKFDFSDAVCFEPCTAHSPGPVPSPTPLSFTEPSPTPETPTLETKVALKCQKELEAKLEKSAETWFGVEAPIPGVKVNLDLRYWVFVLLPWFFLTGIYLHTLRLKQRLVAALGTHRLSTAKAEAVLDVHRLYFDKQSPYTRFPGGLTGLTFVLIYLLLPVYLLATSFPFWAYWGGSSLFGIGLVFGALTLYAVAYCHSVTNRLNGEIARLTNGPAPGNFINAVSSRVKNVVQRVARRLSPRIPLSTGSALLFLTLGLTISQDSCDENLKTYRGYDILVGKEDAHWYSSLAWLDPRATFASVQGRVLYTVALSLALIVILLVVIPWLYRKLNHARFRQTLLAIAGAIVFLSIIDFAGAHVYFALWSGPAGLILCLILLAIWIRYSFSRKEALKEKWKRVRAALAVMSIPFLVMAWLFVFQNLVLPGLIVYFFGVHILFVGLVHIQYRFVSLPPADEQSAAAYKVLK